MRRHFLRVFERAAVGEIGGDAGRAQHVIADLGKNAGSDSTPSDHAPGIRLIHWLPREHGGVVSAAGAEQKALWMQAYDRRKRIWEARHKLGTVPGLMPEDLAMLYDITVAELVADMPPKSL
jgi:hypothetical protein